MATIRNTDLLLKVADRIEHHPENYDQRVWAMDEAHCYLLHGDTTDSLAEQVGCGTSACIAGWAVIEAKQPIPESFVKTYELLGLTAAEAAVLFSEEWLPRGYDEDESDDMYVKRAAEALRRLADGSSIREVTCPDENYMDHLQLRLIRAEVAPSVVL